MITNTAGNSPAAIHPLSQNQNIFIIGQVCLYIQGIRHWWFSGSQCTYTKLQHNNFQEYTQRMTIGETVSLNCRQDANSTKR